MNAGILIFVKTLALLALALASPCRAGKLLIPSAAVINASPTHTDGGFGYQTLHESSYVRVLVGTRQTNQFLAPHYFASDTYVVGMTRGRRKRDDAWHKILPGDMGLVPKGGYIGGNPIESPSPWIRSLIVQVNPAPKVFLSARPAGDDILPQFHFVANALRLERDAPAVSTKLIGEMSGSRAEHIGITNGEPVTVHRGPGKTTVVFVLSGSGTVQGEGVDRPVKSGSIVIAPPDVEALTVTRGPGKDPRQPLWLLRITR